MQESGEMYLETIKILSQKNSLVRSVDIAAFMGYSKPSVSRAVGLLKNDGYINMAQDGSITLTEKGDKIAESIYDRHKTISAILIRLGVSQDTADKDACRMEHVISEETFLAIKKHIKQN